MSPELVVAVILRLPLQRRARREQRGVGLQRGVELLDRLEVIENPQRAPMRGHQQRIVTRMNRELVHTHRGEVRLKPLPALTAIEREENARFGTHVQHVGVARILRERAHHFTGQPRGDRAERRAEIGAHPHIRRIIVLPIVGDRDVHRARLKARRYHLRHKRMTGREARQILRDILPRRTVVLRHAHRAVVGAGVVDTLLLRRLRQRHNRGPL